MEQREEERGARHPPERRPTPAPGAPPHRSSALLPPAQPSTRALKDVKVEGKEQLPKQRPTSVVAGGYRADIDGMRTIAIIGVLLFHIDHHWMPGGFVGVDIFFVISGYVVAGSMLRHKRPAGCGGACENTVAFYSRRIKRLTPSLVLVAFASGALVAMFVPPTAHGSDSQQLLSGMLGLVGGANIQFALGGGVGTKGVDGYFAAQVDTERTPGSTLDWNAFTHNWSLGVEEQYYVLFPIILLAAEHANTIVLICLLLSAALASWMTPAHPVLAFFLMPARFWELAIGALLCALHLGKLGRRLTVLNEFLLSQPLVIAALDVTAIVTITLAYWLTEEKMGFPFPWALLSVFGAVCATSAGAVAPRSYFRGLWPMPLFNFVLRQPAMVYVGKLSYPLYLWHWPLMTTPRWLGMWGGWQGLVAVAVAFVLSVFTYHCVEGWFRNWKPRRKWHIFALLLPMLAAAELWLGLLQLKPLRGKLYIGNHQKPICRALPVPSSYSHAGLAFDCTCRAGSSLHLPPDATPFVLPTVSAAQPGTLQTAPQSEAPCLSDSAVAEATKMGDSGVDSTYCWRSGGLEEGDNTNIAACLGRGSCSNLNAGLSSANVSRPGVFLVGDSHVGNYLVPFRMALNGVSTFSSYASLCGYMEPSFAVGYLDMLGRAEGILTGYPVTLTGCIQEIAAVDHVLTSANGIRPGDVLAISAAAYKFTDDPQGVATHVAFLNRTVALVRARGGKLLLLGSVPILNGRPPKSGDCTTDNLLAGVGHNGRAAFTYCDVDRIVAETRYAPFRAAMRAMADAAADVFFFDPFDLFFANESATGFVPGTQMFAYYDHDHLDENMGGFYLWPFLCSFFKSSGIFG